MEKLTYVNSTTTDKEGNSLKTKAGKPYTRLSLKVESKGDRYVSGFGNTENKDWKVGDEVDIVITESTTQDKNGNPYLNFSMPKKEDKVDEKLEMILNKLTGLIISVETIKEAVRPKKPSTYPTQSNETAFDDVPSEDVPF